MNTFSDNKATFKSPGILHIFLLHYSNENDLPTEMSVMHFLKICIWKNQ